MCLLCVGDLHLHFEDAAAAAAAMLAFRLQCRALCWTESFETFRLQMAQLGKELVCGHSGDCRTKAARKEQLHHVAMMPRPRVLEEEACSCKCCWECTTSAGEGKNKGFTCEGALGHIGELATADIKWFDNVSEGCVPLPRRKMEATSAWWWFGQNSCNSGE